MRLQQSCCERCNRRIETGDRVVQIRTGNAGLPFWRIWFGLISPFGSGIGEGVIHLDCIEELDEFDLEENYPEVFATELTKALGGEEPNGNSSS